MNKSNTQNTTSSFSVKDCWFTRSWKCKTQLQQSCVDWKTDCRQSFFPVFDLMLKTGSILRLASSYLEVSWFICTPNHGLPLRLRPSELWRCIASGTVLSRSCGVEAGFQLFEVMPIPQCCQAKCITNHLQPRFGRHVVRSSDLGVDQAIFSPWQRATDQKSSYTVSL